MNAFWEINLKKNNNKLGNLKASYRIIVAIFVSVFLPLRSPSSKLEAKTLFRSRLAIHKHTIAWFVLSKFLCKRTRFIAVQVLNRMGRIHCKIVRCSTQTRSSQCLINCNSPNRTKSKLLILLFEMCFVPFDSWFWLRGHRGSKTERTRQQQHFMPITIWFVLKTV